MTFSDIGQVETYNTPLNANPEHPQYHTYLPDDGGLVEFIWYFIRIRFDASDEERISLRTNREKKRNNVTM